MRFVMYGAGAIGGVVGARLHQHGHEVVFIARGAHYEAIRRPACASTRPRGWSRSRSTSSTLPTKVDFRAGDVVVLGDEEPGHRTTHSTALAAVAPSSTPVVCMQNGVANERAALRYFAPVYGVCVVCPAVHLEAGPRGGLRDRHHGLFDIGRFPNGHGRARGAHRRRARLVDLRVRRAPRHHAVEVPQAHQQPEQRDRRAVRARRSRSAR